jgi:hypothetical protein
LRNALTTSAPMPCDAPVTTTTFCDVLMLYSRKRDYLA